MVNSFSLFLYRYVFLMENKKCMQTLGQQGAINKGANALAQVSDLCLVPEQR